MPDSFSVRRSPSGEPVICFCLADRLIHLRQTPDLRALGRNFVEAAQPHRPVNDADVEVLNTNVPASSLVVPFTSFNM